MDIKIYPIVLEKGVIQPGNNFKIKNSNTNMIIHGSIVTTNI
jgi:hypothetical protein